MNNSSRFIVCSILTFIKPILRYCLRFEIPLVFSKSLDLNLSCLGFNLRGLGPVCKSAVSYIQCYLLCLFCKSFLFSLLASCMELGNYCMSFLIPLLCCKLCCKWCGLCPLALLSIDMSTRVRTRAALTVVKEVALVVLRSSIHLPCYLFLVSCSALFLVAQIMPPVS